MKTNFESPCLCKAFASFAGHFADKPSSWNHARGWTLAQVSSWIRTCEVMGSQLVTDANKSLLILHHPFSGVLSQNLQVRIFRHFKCKIWEFVSIHRHVQWFYPQGTLNLTDCWDCQHYPALPEAFILISTTETIVSTTQMAMGQN